MNDPALVRLELRGRGFLTTRIGAAVWVAGWIATEASALSQGLQYGWTAAGIVSLGLWTLVGAVGLTAIIWAAAGRPEVVALTGRMLELRRGIGPFARTQRFDGSAIRALRVLETGSPFKAEYGSHPGFLGSRRGPDRVRSGRAHVRIRADAGRYDARPRAVLDYGALPARSGPARGW